MNDGINAHGTVHDLVHTGTTLPSTHPEHVAVLTDLQDVVLAAPQITLATEHVIHAGMYARTIRLEPDTMIIGALIKIPTMLIVHGSCAVLVDGTWYKLEGYNVFPASAHRKQVFVVPPDAEGVCEITMLFPTTVKTVEEAEQEFTDEAEMLVSRRSVADIITITGE